MINIRVYFPKYGEAITHKHKTKILIPPFLTLSSDSGHEGEKQDLCGKICVGIMEMSGYQGNSEKRVCS